MSRLKYTGAHLAKTRALPTPAILVNHAASAKKPGQFW
jgi:hypothetical protein